MMVVTSGIGYYLLGRMYIRFLQGCRDAWRGALA
jgi:hypothetical protein